MIPPLSPGLKKVVAIKKIMAFLRGVWDIVTQLYANCDWITGTTSNNMATPIKSTCLQNRGAEVYGGQGSDGKSAHCSGVKMHAPQGISGLPVGARPAAIVSSQTMAAGQPRWQAGRFFTNH